MLEKVRQHKNELWNWLTKQTYFQTRTPQNFYSKIIYLDLCLLWHIVERARASASASASVCVDGSSECSIMFCGVQYDASKCTFTEIASASTIPAPSKYSLTESKKKQPRTHTENFSLETCHCGVARLACICIRRICGWVRFSNDSKPKSFVIKFLFFSCVCVCCFALFIFTMWIAIRCAVLQWLLFG